MAIFTRGAPAKGATPDYERTEWANGNKLSEGPLNNLEAGVYRATMGVKALESATVKVNVLEPGEAATATYENGEWTFNLPKGDRGVQGPQGAAGAPGRDGAAGPAGPAGAKGENGAAGATGAAGAAGPKGDRGNTVRFYKKNATASQENTVAELVPNKDAIPLAVNDLVITQDKKIFTITAIKADKWTASAEHGQLA